MEKILVSRCLLGHRVRYDGGAHGPHEQLAFWQAEGRIVPLCPAVSHGLQRRFLVARGPRCWTDACRS